MSDNDIVKRNRALIVNALANLRQEWEVKLNQLKEKAAELSSRPDIVWHMIVQSLSGMGNNRGYFNLIENQENYNRICWQRIASVSENERLRALSEALSFAKVRMAVRKAGWLHVNYGRIQEMGGIDGARQKMGVLRGYMPKLLFFQKFKGIKEKYGRNIWMDLYDVDFRNSIAIDTRIKDVCSLIGIDTQDYQQAEGALLNLANEAGRDGWEIDRLLFHFYQDFKMLLFDREATSVTTKQQSNTFVKTVLEPVTNNESTMGIPPANKISISNTKGHRDNMKISTSKQAINRAKDQIVSSGFTVEVLPGKKGIRGQGDFIVSASNAKKFAKVRVKGHGDVNNPCWFSLTFYDEDVQSAKDSGKDYDEAWRINVGKYEFFILISIPLDKMWLFTPQQIINLIEINLKKYDWPKERQTKKKVEMNFEVEVDGERLSQLKDYDDNLISEKNNFTLLQSWLTE